MIPGIGKYCRSDPIWVAWLGLCMHYFLLLLYCLPHPHYDAQELEPVVVFKYEVWSLGCRQFTPYWS